MNDYERIAAVIRYLDKHHVEQPDLSTLARHVGLSSFHFHRLFSKWAAITPKDFLQCLTISHASALLQDSRSVMDAAIASGLSGPGRLHDLCIQLEAASPGEIKSGGAGWTISAGYTASPFGRCLIAESPRGICHLSFTDASTGKADWRALQAKWPCAVLHHDDRAADRLARKIFARPDDANSDKSVRACVSGTSFQVKVWRALLQIPAGTLVSYGQLAASLDHSRAARAVGAAVGQNPIAYLIPCHRVIRETGIIGNYRWGSTRKRMIIAWEGSTGVAPSSGEASVA